LSGGSIPPARRPAEFSRSLLPFLWQCAEGLRPACCDDNLTGLIGAFEALLFSMLGKLIDWMGRSARTLLTDQRVPWILAAILPPAPSLSLAAWLKYQAIHPVFHAAALDLASPDAQPEHELLL
jgi:ATP-binding cassette subfamily B multidrug efflux pump